LTLEVMLIVLFAALLHAVWNALIKSGSDKLLDSVMLCLAAGVIAMTVLPFLPAPAAASWGHLVGSTLIHVVYFCLVALAYRGADMSFIYPLMRGAAPLFTALIAVFAVGESLSWGGWMGVILLCAGVASLALDGLRARPHVAAGVCQCCRDRQLHGGGWRGRAVVGRCVELCVVAVRVDGLADACRGLHHPR